MDLDFIDIGWIVAIFTGLGAAGEYQRRVSSSESGALQDATLSSLYSSALEVDLQSCSTKDIGNLRAYGGIVGIQGFLTMSTNHKAFQFSTQQPGSNRSYCVKAVASSKLNFEVGLTRLISLLSRMSKLSLVS